jgi:hypothetical protein
MEAYLHAVMDSRPRQRMGGKGSKDTTHAVFRESHDNAETHQK